jgi:hypothetical protein
MTSKPKSTEVQFDRPRTKLVEVEFGDVVQILAMINGHGQSRKLASRTKGAAHKVRLPSETVVAVKELVAAHPEMRRSSLGKRVLYARKPRRPSESKAAAAAVSRTVSSVATGNQLCCGFGAGG